MRCQAQRTFSAGVYRCSEAAHHSGMHCYSIPAPACRVCGLADAEFLYGTSSLCRACLKATTNATDADLDEMAEATA